VTALTNSFSSRSVLRAPRRGLSTTRRSLRSSYRSSLISHIKAKTSPTEPAYSPVVRVDAREKKLTLIDTSTDILISDATARLSDEYPAVHAFDVFEFTVLGVIVLITGTIYRRMSNRSMP
jgi:hypothetical protein